MQIPVLIYPLCYTNEPWMFLIKVKSSGQIKMLIGCPGVANLSLKLLNKNNNNKQIIFDTVRTWSRHMGDEQYL